MSLQDTEQREIAPYKLTRISKLMRSRIYFIKCGEYVRFSRSSSSPLWVMRATQPFCPYEMKIIKDIPGDLKLQMELEKTFHRYQHHSLWFRYEGELKEWLESQVP